jgi:hypothetical protein
MQSMYIKSDTIALHTSTIFSFLTFCKSMSMKWNWVEARRSSGLYSMFNKNPTTDHVMMIFEAMTKYKLFFVLPYPLYYYYLSSSINNRQG